MEVRLSHVTLSVPSSPSPSSADDASARATLPTIGRELRRAVGCLAPSKRPSGDNAPAKPTTRAVLRDVSGVFRPGSMTLVLGQPRAGKSLLLKLLSGRLHAATQIACAGQVTFGGVPQSDLRGRLPQLVGYVPQRDVHFPTLTALETVAFAHACGARPSADGEGEESPAATRLDQLGLTHCRDTVVGDDMLRGVSGGERKRVTLGEMDVAGRRAVCLDEVSTGLDSAATLDIARQYRARADRDALVVVMALLQPAPEVVALFDTVILLHDGYVMYHGPRADALDYFAGLGLRCPPNRDAADFLMDLGTSQQTPYEQQHHETPGKGSRSPPPRRASEFAERFQQSEIYRALLQEVDCPSMRNQELEETLLHVPEFYQPFWANVARLVKRDLLVTARNTAVLQARAVTIVISSLLHATLFYQLDAANVQLVMGIMFATVLFLALEQSSQIPAFQAARKVFYKQRDANMYSAPAFVVASSIAQLPVAVFQVVVFGSVVYWVCGLTATAGQFLVFELLLLLTNLAFSAWFFFLAAVTPNLHVAEPYNLLSLLLFILFAGFMIVRGLIPDYFIWVYWISPMAWCLRSIVINQYSADEFSECVYKGVDYCATYGVDSMGEYALDVFQLPSGRVWLWMGVVFMVVVYFFFMGIATIALERIRFDEHDSHLAPLQDHAGISDDISTDSEDATAMPTTEYRQVETPRGHVEVTIPKCNDDTDHDRRHFTPVTLAFKNLWYSVPKPGDSSAELTLLRGISGFAEPGTITALMGSSGAGKTTLMDVIAGRKTGGTIRGEIFLNGHAATDVAIRRCTAYCEQMDVHAEAATVREALTFSAFLRQSSAVPASHKHDAVEECLDLLDLRPIADCIVRGSSVEQLKRLTIGVELAAQPSVLFLDEPTSGLDARAAKMIMDGVRKVADSGRTIVCTIHQPSFEVFQVFDRLLLLKRGGETVYFGGLGARGRAIVEYFEAIDGVAPIPSGDYNPATWMLDVIGAGVGSAPSEDQSVVSKASADFVAHFQASEKKAELDAALDRDGLTRPAEGVAPLAFSAKRAASEATQAGMLLQRFFRTYWRTPDYMLTRAAVYVMLALVFGLSFVGRDYDTYQGANAGVALLYSTTVFIGVVAFEAALPMASELRASFYRERAAETYNAFWYFVGASVVEVPYVLVVTFLFCAIFFPLAGFVGVAKFIVYWLSLSLHVLLQTYLGELLAILLPDLGSAMAVGVVVSAVCFNTMGFNPPASALPAAYKWLYEIVPTKFAFSLVGAVIFGQCDEATPDDLACRPLRGELPPAFPAGTTLEQYVARVFLISRDDITLNVLLMVAYVAATRVLTLLALRFVNHQRK